MQKLPHDIDVHATQINQWKRLVLDSLPELFTDKTKVLRVDYESQLAQLYQQIGRLKVENDFLKKNAINLVSDRRGWLEPGHPELSIRQQCVLLGQQLYCNKKEKFKMTTDSRHQLPIAPNLLQRNFSVLQPNRCYVSDISYIPTQEGWLYLAVVIDLFSRQVVGWAMDKHMKTSLVNKALLMAIWKRKPKRGLLWHTDRGSQYASDSHRDLIKEHGIIRSMSRKGDCWDNAVAESFLGTLKIELIYQCVFKTREEAKQAIFEYIEIFYNRIRIHSANNYLSPVAFEKLKRAVKVFVRKSVDTSADRIYSLSYS